MHPRKPRLPFANAWFFPAAALYAAVMLPVSVLGMLGLMPTLPGLATPGGHAHEMLFGFALAVVAGYLLGPQPRAITLALLVAWALARIAFLLWPGSLPAILMAGTFAAGLVWRVVPRFLGAAKKWRNQSVAPLVTGLALASTLGGLGASTGAWLRGEALLLLAALMFFMGGRIIAPALAGHAQQQGWRLDARVQPRIEGTVLILLGTALVLGLLPWELPERVGGACLVAAGLLTGMRLLRWRPWRCLNRPDLLVLLAGYAWLAVGLLAMGVPTSLGSPVPSALLHALTVGALGTLTFAVMGRTRLIQRWRDPNARGWIHPFAAFISLAALARIVPALLGAPMTGWLLLAAAAWSVAFLALTTLFWHLRGDDRRLDPGD